MNNEKSSVFVSETGKLCEIITYHSSKDNKTNNTLVVYNCIAQYQGVTGLHLSFQPKYIDKDLHW